jgi:murein DD-endopeptidase MepM/ murein hydrolase activator NlpD
MLAGCATKIPEPPVPAAEPAPQQVEAVSLSEPVPDLSPPLPLAPAFLWNPTSPGEGALVVLVLEPAGLGLPILEVRAMARDADLPLAYLSGGAYLGLVPAPLRTEEVPVEISVTLADGTKIDQSLALQIVKRDFPSTRLRVASRFTAPDQATLTRIQRERDFVRGVLWSTSDEPLWNGEFILPLVGVTTSAYGQRRLFNNELRSQHTGLDVDGDTGDPVIASNSGRVVISRDLFFNGQAVFIDHGLGFYTGYFHLSKREVDEGQWVEKGEVVGLVGATGRVTGPHLHWALYVQGAALDPLSLLDQDLALVSERLAPPRH